MNRARIIHLLKAVDPDGPMHIVVGDGNMEDDHLNFIDMEMRLVGASLDEVELLRLLRALPLAARIEMWVAAHAPWSKPHDLSRIFG